MIGQIKKILKQYQGFNVFSCEDITELLWEQSNTHVHKQVNKNDFIAVKTIQILKNYHRLCIENECVHCGGSGFIYTHSDPKHNEPPRKKECIECDCKGIIPSLLKPEMIWAGDEPRGYDKWLKDGTSNYHHNKDCLKHQSRLKLKYFDRWMETLKLEQTALYQTSDGSNYVEFFYDGSVMVNSINYKTGITPDDFMQATGEVPNHNLINQIITTKTNHHRV